MERIIKDSYVWRKFPGYLKDWYIELFMFKENGKERLPFMIRKNGLIPHSLVLDLNHPEYKDQSKIEIYSGAIICGKNTEISNIGSALFSRGKFIGGHFGNYKLDSLDWFRKSLDEYFEEYSFKPTFGEYFPEFFGNSNLDEEVMATFAELFGY